jgi:hypothetical protein
MPAEDEAARREILARLAQSREELRHMLDPVRTEADDEAASGDHADGFPRSRTMQMLMSGRGLGILAAVAGGLFIARPALALRLIRMLPASALARWVMVRAVTALRGNAKPNGAGGEPVVGVSPVSPARSDSGRHPPA